MIINFAGSRLSGAAAVGVGLTCTLCGAHVCYSFDLCSVCSARPKEDGSTPSIEDVVADSPLEGVMAVSAMRLILDSRHDVSVAGAINNLASKSWGMNMLTALDVNVDTKYTIAGSVLVETLSRVTLSVQLFCDGLKGPLRDARNSEADRDDKIRAVLGAYASHIMAVSPMEFVTNATREVCMAILHAFDAQVEASRTDTPARSAACTAFVAMLPLPFQIPVREAFADWRNRFLVNASGNTIMFGTMMEYAAALFSHEFAPVLKPAPFRQWITISKNEVIRDASKNHGTIADYIGNDFNLGLGDGSSVWAGSRGVLRAIGMESDDDSGAAAQRANDEEQLHAAAASQRARSSSASDSAPDHVWHRLRDICTIEHFANLPGMWRVLDAKEQIPDDHDAVCSHDKRFICMPGSGSRRGAKAAPCSSTEEQDDERLLGSGEIMPPRPPPPHGGDKRRAAAPDHDANSDSSNGAAFEPEAKGGGSPARGDTNKGGGTHKKQTKSLSWRQRRTRSRSPAADGDDSSPPRSRKRLNTSVVKQSAANVDRLQNSSRSVTAQDFARFLASRNCHGLRISMLFEDDDEREEQQFHMGHIVARGIRNGRTNYKMVFDDGDTAWKRPLEIFRALVVYNSAHMPVRKSQRTRGTNHPGSSAGGRASQPSSSSSRKGGRRKGRQQKARQGQASRPSSASPLVESASASDPSHQSGGESVAFDDEQPFCAAGCGTIVDNDGDECDDCGGGYCRRVDCDAPTFGGYEFCSTDCARATHSARKRSTRQDRRKRRTIGNHSVGTVDMLPDESLPDSARMEAQSLIAGYTPDARSMIGKQLSRGEKYADFEDVVQQKITEPVHILLQLDYTAVTCAGNDKYSIPKLQKDLLRSFKRQPRPPGSQIDENSLLIALSDSTLKPVRQRVRLPNMWPEIFSHDRFVSVFGMIDEHCCHWIKHFTRMVHDPMTSAAATRSAKSSFVRWTDLRFNFKSLYTVIEGLLRDARYNPSSDGRVAATTRVFNYLGFVLYLSRATDNHALLCFGGTHSWLWERAALGGLPPPKVKRMRDPWKLPFKRSIAAFGPGGTSAAPTRRPSKDTNASRPTRPRRGDRLPDSVMADAPPSVFDKFKNRCFKCGGANHSTSNCPLSAKTNPTSAEQKRLTDTAKEIKRIRKRRQDYVNDKKRGRT